MKIGDKNIKEIQILTKGNELLASITDEDVIEEESVTVLCVPSED